MAFQRILARTGVAILGVSSALMLAALPASAAPSSPLTGTITGDDEYTGSVNLVQQGEQPTSLMGLWVNGTVDYMYCVELTVREGRPGSTMVQQPWDNFPPDPNSTFTANATQINWVLHNSFPLVSDLSALGDLAGTDGTLSAPEAVAATQAAIWHYSERNADLDQSDNDANVVKLYDYLTGSSNTGLNQPTASTPALTITPTNGSGPSGSLIGPYTVSSNLGGPLALDASGLSAGVSLTDDKGKAVNPATVVDGSKLYFDVPNNAPAGQATIKLSGEFQVGELFVGQDVASAAAAPGGVRANCGGANEQSLIVAQSTPVSASAGVNWTAPVTTPTPTSPATQPAAPVPTTTTPPPASTTASTLPYTGVSVVGPLVFGLLLVGAGSAFLIAQRRRKRA